MGCDRNSAQLCTLAYRHWATRARQWDGHEANEVTPTGPSNQYARAYNQTPEAPAFYDFTGAIRAYNSMIEENTILVLSTENDLYNSLKWISPDGVDVPILE